MTALRILLIDDDADIREIATISLGLDPEFSVRGCASGEEGLAAVAECAPDLILLDVMMPSMDGPTTLARLRDDERNADIPVIFMTARAQSREIEQFKLLGAAGVIAKPFDPMTLVGLVRSLLQPIGNKLAESREHFLTRLTANAETLAGCRSDLSNETRSLSALTEIRDVAHGLAGAAGNFGFSWVGDAAADLESAATASLGGVGDQNSVEHALDSLLACVALILPDFRRELTPPIFDRTLHESLRESFGPDRLRVLLAKFEAQVEAGALVNTDWASDRLTLLQQSHRMIATAGALGFPALSDVSREIEDACWQLEDQVTALTEILKRANEITLSTKRALDAALTDLARAA